ncbi:MAG: TetR family transcriptional regulator [Verrucomicrobiota bacterium]
MRVLKVPESGPKRNLLDATERLVVEKGFDLVSVRDITGAIKANVAAVNYHFGSREGLMDLVMSHVMEAVDAARVEALEAGKKGGVEEIVSAYVNSVLSAAGRVEMDLPFFLKLAGRVMVFPTELMSQALADGRKQMNDLYLKALAGAVPQMATADVEAAWAFFDAGLGQSLVNLLSDLAPSVQAEHWIRFGVRGLAGTGISQKLVPADQTDPTALSDKTEPTEAAVAPETAETPKPAKAPRPKLKKPDDQSMMFDF